MQGRGAGRMNTQGEDPEEQFVHRMHRFAEILRSAVDVSDFGHSKDREGDVRTPHRVGRVP